MANRHDSNLATATMNTTASSTDTFFVNIEPPTFRSDIGISLDHDIQREEKALDDVVLHQQVGRDDVDALSQWSLVMSKDIRYYMQHPYARIFIAYGVIFCNFFIYAEDPITHSFIECNIPVIGNVFSLFFTKYPPNGFSALKSIMALAGIIAGMCLGVVIHRYLFNRLFNLRMFFDSKGSWMIMFLTSIITVFIASYIYTAFLMAAGDYTLPYRISQYLGITNSRFTKITAIGTWLGDVFTAWMVTDIMLQDHLYPNWAPGLRRWWRQGYKRIYLFWAVVGISTFVTVLVITTDWVQWDSINKNVFHTGEMERAFLASAILVFDFAIVLQDWDFPHFISNFDIKLPGVNVHKVEFKFLQRIHVHVTGKWFNYGILFFVMILDMNMWKNQILYVPFDFGQYVGPDERIHTPRDAFTLANFRNSSLFDFYWRENNINPLTNNTYASADHVQNARYHHSEFFLKALAFIPSILMMVVFVGFIIFFGREKPTDDNPYVGRMKKRRRRSLHGKTFQMIFDTPKYNVLTDDVDGGIGASGIDSEAGGRTSKVFTGNENLPFCDASQEDLRENGATKNEAVIKKDAITVDKENTNVRNMVVGDNDVKIDGRTDKNTPLNQEKDEKTMKTDRKRRRRTRDYSEQYENVTLAEVRAISEIKALRKGKKEKSTADTIGEKSEKTRTEKTRTKKKIEKFDGEAIEEKSEKSRSIKTRANRKSKSEKFDGETIREKSRSIKTRANRRSKSEKFDGVAMSERSKMSKSGAKRKSKSERFDVEAIEEISEKSKSEKSRAGRTKSGKLRRTKSDKTKGEQNEILTKSQKKRIADGADVEKEKKSVKADKTSKVQDSALNENKNHPQTWNQERQNSKDNITML